MGGTTWLPPATPTLTRALKLMDPQEMMRNMMASMGMDPEQMASMFQARSSGMPFVPPPGMMGSMPAPPGCSGYDFISGNRGRAAEVERLPMTDEWWVVASAKLNDPWGPHDEESDDDDDDDYVTATVKFLDKQVEGGKVASVNVGLTAAMVTADYRANTLSGTAELLYRTLLTACVKPLQTPFSGTPGDTGHAKLDKQMRKLRRPRRPAVVLLPSAALARALQPALACLSIEARSMSRRLRRATSSNNVQDQCAATSQTFKVPRGEWRVDDDMRPVGLFKV